MAEETGALVIRLTGKELANVTGKVKGMIQNTIKTTHKYPDAEFSTHRREGWIRTHGVPIEVLKEAVLRAQSSLLPHNRFDFDIVAEDSTEEKVSQEPEEEAHKLFVLWMEQAQRGWKEQAQGYEQEIANIQKDSQQLKKDKDNLLQLMRQEKESASRLQASYNEVSALLERLSAERVQPPYEAGRLWVGDWSIVAVRLERELAKMGLTTKLSEANDLLGFDLDSLWLCVKKEIGEGIDLPKELAAIEQLSQANTWEESDKYLSLVKEYERAKAEIEYVQAIKEGKAVIPDSLVETFIKAVDLENNRRIAFEFEAEEAAFRQRTASSGRVAQLIERHRVAEALRTFRANLQNEKPTPGLLTCDRLENKWRLSLLLPASEGVLSAALRDCVRKTSDAAEVKISEEKRQENILNFSMVIPGSVQTWKDASRKQERFALDFVKSFVDCGFHALGLRLALTKIMEVSPD